MGGSYTQRAASMASRACRTSELCRPPTTEPSKCGTSLGRFRFTDLSRVQCLHTLRGHRSSVLCVAALPRDRIVSGSRDKTLKVWDVKHGLCLQTLRRAYGLGQLRRLSVGRPGRIWIAGQDAQGVGLHQVLRRPLGAGRPVARARVHGRLLHSSRGAAASSRPTPSPRSSPQSARRFWIRPTCSAVPRRSFRPTPSRTRMWTARRWRSKDQADVGQAASRCARRTMAPPRPLGRSAAGRRGGVGRRRGRRRRPCRRRAALRADDGRQRGSSTGDPPTSPSDGLLRRDAVPRTTAAGSPATSASTGVPPATLC